MKMNRKEITKVAQDGNLKLEIINLKNEIQQLPNLFNYENLYKVSTETEEQDNSFEKIGKSKKEILICAGVPSRSQQVDDMEFLTYYSGGFNHESNEDK